MRRDRITFAMMLGIPLLQLILFGYAINTDPKRLDAALLALGQRPYTRAPSSRRSRSATITASSRGRTPTAEAEALIASGDVAVPRHHPERFRRRASIAATSRKSCVEADATDPAAASNAHRRARRARAARAAARAGPRGGGRRSRRPARSTIIVHRRYNPDGVSQYNIVPGLLGVILQMTMVMMTSIALTRELERGTMENLLAMPANGAEIMLGKVLPFFVVGAVQVAVILGAARLLFQVPFVGSLTLLLLAVLVFVHGAGAARLHVLHVRAHADAGDAAHLLLLPAVDPALGLHVPVSRHAGLGAGRRRVLPLTHFLRVVRAVMLKGANLHEVGFELTMLACSCRSTPSSR